MSSKGAGGIGSLLAIGFSTSIGTKSHDCSIFLKVANLSVLIGSDSGLTCAALCTHAGFWLRFEKYQGPYCIDDQVLLFFISY